MDYCDIKWFALDMNRDHSVIFEMHPNTAFQTLLLTMMTTPFLLRDSFPQKELTTLSSTLAWKIPWTEEPSQT